jgi:hypothetical protein
VADFYQACFGQIVNLLVTPITYVCPASIPELLRAHATTRAPPPPSSAFSSSAGGDDHTADGDTSRQPYNGHRGFSNDGGGGQGDPSKDAATPMLTVAILEEMEVLLTVTSELMHRQLLWATRLSRHFASSSAAVGGGPDGGGSGSSGTRGIEFVVDLLLGMCENFASLRHAKDVGVILGSQWEDVENYWHMPIADDEKADKVGFKRKVGQLMHRIMQQSVSLLLHHCPDSKPLVAAAGDDRREVVDFEVQILGIQQLGEPLQDSLFRLLKIASFVTESVDMTSDLRALEPQLVAADCSLRLAVHNILLSERQYEWDEGSEDGHHIHDTLARIFLGHLKRLSQAAGATSGGAGGLVGEKRKNSGGDELPPQYSDAREELLAEFDENTSLLWLWVATTLVELQEFKRGCEHLFRLMEQKAWAASHTVLDCRASISVVRTDTIPAHELASPPPSESSSPPKEKERRWATHLLSLTPGPTYVELLVYSATSSDTNVWNDFLHRETNHFSRKYGRDAPVCWFCQQVDTPPGQPVRVVFESLSPPPLMHSATSPHRIMGMASPSFRDRDTTMVSPSTLRKSERGGKSSSEKDWPAVCNRLRSHGVQPHDLGGDGDCQFRAIAHHLGATDDREAAASESGVGSGAGSSGRTHQDVRAEVVEFMRESKEFRKTYSAFSTTRSHKAFDAWLDEMEAAGTPGDHLTIIAAAKCYNRPIVVVQYDRGFYAPARDEGVASRLGRGASEPIWLACLPEKDYYTPTKPLRAGLRITPLSQVVSDMTNLSKYYLGEIPDRPSVTLVERERGSSLVPFSSSSPSPSVRGGVPSSRGGGGGGGDSEEGVPSFLYIQYMIGEIAAKFSPSHTALSLRMPGGGGSSPGTSSINPVLCHPNSASCHPKNTPFLDLQFWPKN